MLKLEKVSVNLGTSKILDKINLEIPANKITTIIGPSGAGKSTLLRLFNRLVSPAEGKITFKGKNIEEVDVIQLRNRVGMVFQLPVLFPGTVLDNLSYGPSLKGVREDDYALYCLKLVGLDKSFAEKDVSSLSGGEQQRVSLARTLANKPEVLLLDEPTSALDPASTEHIEKTICQLKSSLNLTIIWITHDLNQAKRVSDYVVFLAGGKVIEAGTKEQLFSNPKEKLTKLFLAGQLAEKRRDNP